jgi:GH15 family glucan-1,4-alpha-glucosidase
MVDVVAISGKAEEAESLFKKILSMQNSLGLIAEEYSVDKKFSLVIIPRLLVISDC